MEMRRNGQEEGSKEMEVTDGAGKEHAKECCSLIMNVDTTGNTPGVFGNALASTTLKPLTPLTLNLPSKTAAGSPFFPLAAVEVG